MASRQSELVLQAKVNAKKGDVLAMEFLARRYFEGRGTYQCFQQSCYWSSIALHQGMGCLKSLNVFAWKKLSPEEKLRVDKKLKKWFNKEV